MNKFNNLDMYENINTFEMLRKLGEECTELIKSILNQDKENQKEEICDCIQVLHGIAYTLDINIEECIEKHNEKLLSRGHKFI